MAPKKKQTRLDRAQLEEAAAERIDAVTADALHPTKFVEIVSPDGKLRLFYNTSTLVRIGLDKGHFMQPPHFREPMKSDLIELVEKLEGRRIVFETVNHRTGVIDVDGAHLAEIEHHHIHFQQIVDEFYLLSPAEVYVCPTCLCRWIESNPDWRRPVDPLDALQEIDDERLGQLTFRYARDFNKHLATHHYMADDSKDHTLRATLCKYFSDFNEVHNGQLSLHWYWIMNARYNVVRYNRVVEVAEAAQRRGDAWKFCSFPEPETRAFESTTSKKEEKFIVSDDESEGDDNFGIPVYEEESSEVSDSDDEQSASSSEETESSPRPSKRPRESDSDSDSSTSDADEAGYIKSHPQSDRRTYNERAYVQREMEKIHRKEAKDFTSTVRRTVWTEDSQNDIGLPEDDGAWGAFINGSASLPQRLEGQILLDDEE
ncbi:Hypothetical protein, putative [Bodo saltans]|uniref:Uncharacterized protein n=1 Tax=Bodo saltans TaxID=75058 RepID=A0A0S4J651_BODSA|nr:Hypothetical protein, putative [Bodo saltans]|eukprot:CUG86898.1 Hypothetical protein, putative [Bodo saltans]